MAKSPRIDLKPNEVSVMWLLHFMHRRRKCAEGWQVQSQVLFRPPLDHFLSTMVHHESLEYSQRVRSWLDFRAHLSPPPMPTLFFLQRERKSHLKKVKLQPSLILTYGTYGKKFITGGLSPWKTWGFPKNQTGSVASSSTKSFSQCFFFGQFPRRPNVNTPPYHANKLTSSIEIAKDFLGKSVDMQKDGKRNMAR